MSVWVREVRAQFLTITPVAVFLGVATAYYEYGLVKVFNTILALVGCLLAHIAVNVLNDYFDYISGIDLKTVKTPFSGGSGILPKGLLSPKSILALGILSIVGGLCIAIYFYMSYGLPLLILVIIGVIDIVLYTPVFANIGLGEFSVFLGFGPLMVLGTHLIASGHLLSPSALYTSMVYGILVANILLLNEIPDVEADKSGGRRTIPIIFGVRNSIIVYAILESVAYALIVYGVIVKALPLYTLIALVGVMLTYKATVKALKGYNKLETLLPSLAINILKTHIVGVLMAIGVLLGAIF